MLPGDWLVPGHLLLLRWCANRHHCLLRECLALDEGSGTEQEAGCALGARLGPTAPAPAPGEPGSPQWEFMSSHYLDSSSRDPHSVSFSTFMLAWMWNFKTNDFRGDCPLERVEKFSKKDVTGHVPNKGESGWGYPMTQIPGNQLRVSDGFCLVDVDAWQILFLKSSRQDHSETCASLTIFLFSHSVVSNSATPWTAACQAPLVHEILQAKMLEWVAIPFSRGSSQHRDWTWVSCIAGRCFTIWATREVNNTI